MFGLGKKRSKYGKFLDDNGVKQGDISKHAGLNRETVTKASREDDPKMRGITKKALADAASKASGKKVKEDDFW